VFAAQINGITGAWITPLSRLSIMEREATEPTDLNALPRGQRLSHVIDQEFSLPTQRPWHSTGFDLSHQIDQLTPRHIGNLIQYRPILADPRAEGKLLIFIKFIDVSAQPFQHKKRPANAGPECFAKQSTDRPSWL
jgi:hypothetical protein